MKATTNNLPAYFQSRPVAIEKTRLPELVERGREQAARVAMMTASDIDAAVMAAADAPLGRMIGAVAVIPIRGCITQKSDFYSWYFGGTSVERLTMSFRQYVNDPNVSAIVFDVDSPGGEVYGLQECFEELYAARGVKKTFAICNPFMASAAYFLGCAAEKIWMTKSGQCGSVGCYTLHASLEGMLKEAGIEMTFIQHGEHKTDGNSYQPLSEDAHAELQATVDFYGTQFDRAVATGRGISEKEVLASFGQGKLFTAPTAKKIRMIDQIGTRDELLAKLAPGRARMMAAAVEPAVPVASAPAAAVAAPAPVASVNEEAAAEAQRQADADAIALALALTES